MAISELNIGTEVVGENRKPKRLFFTVISSLISFINNAPVILDSSGSPEGVVTGKFKDQYWDTTSDKLYFKSTATGNTGWILIN
ncbi:MAG TPA: hypothetical protein EYN67_10265 [Flavobacteriales bacterium]|nr:hypothetical protein [Flavobacteriales bacterium]